MKITKSFVAGIMNKDLDERLIPDGQYVDAMNIQIGSSEATNVGAVENEYGNKALTAFSHTNAKAIGAIAVEETGCIYWFVASDSGNYVYEYNQNTGNTVMVLGDTRPGANNVLNFEHEYLITGVNYINGFLCWTDDLNPPRKVNVQRAKAYGLNGFYEEDINVIVKPPLNAPTVAAANDPDRNSNNMEGKFLYFSYRFKYQDGEYSALAPFSRVAFEPGFFAVNATSGVNEAMKNANNAYNITFETGGENVEAIQLVFRDTANTNVNIIETLDKEEMKYDDNSTATFLFSNSKLYAPLTSDQVTRLFDNVPLKAKAQELVGNRLAYGNYLQFYDINDCDGVDIDVNYTVSLKSSTYDDLGLSEGDPTPSFKSNRDYEIGVVYLDDYGRMTTVQTSPENTVFVGPDASDKKNELFVNIYNEAPCFATKYRLVLKQAKGDYYNIFPTFFVDDGEYKYFKINQADVDKVQINKYITFKTDVNGVNDTGSEYKVIDLKYYSTGDISKEEPAIPGVYIKVSIDDDVAISESAIQKTKLKGEGMNSTDKLLSRIYALTPPYTQAAFCHQKTLDPYVVFGASSLNVGGIVENPIYYGTNSSAQLSIGNSNKYSGSEDERWTIEITEKTGSTVKFNYYAFEETTPISDVDITITAGVEIGLKNTTGGTDVGFVVFPTTNGLEVGDKWIVNARSGGNNPVNYFGLPFGFDSKQRLGGFAIIPANDPIYPGAQITFKISESQNVQEQPLQTFTSSRFYENMEEWFIQDGIYKKFVMLSGSAVGDDPNTNKGARSVSFRRGIEKKVVTIDKGSTNVVTTSSVPSTRANSDLFMFIQGYANAEKNKTLNLPGEKLDSFACQRNHIVVKVEISQLTKPIIIETIPTESDADIYHELSDTYDIVNGLHEANEQNQTRMSPSTTQKPAIVKINDFNCFTFGNGCESYRIRDDFNAYTMKYSLRAASTSENYGQERVKNGVTYSGVYQVTSGLNKLNEFNLSNANFKYLDQDFGSIQKLYARDTDIIVFQENKVSKVLYEKNLLSDAVGGGTVASIPQVLGTQIAYSGEYGISNNPESFAQWGNNLFFTDERRGAALRLGQDGMFEISSQGMRDWFRDLFIADGSTQKIGAYDPYHGHYVLTSTETNAVACDFDISRNKLFVGETGSSEYLFTIRSNSAWTITYSAAWLTNVTLSGSGNQDIYGTLAQNTSGSVRSVVVSVTGCSGTESFTLEQGPSTKKKRVVVVVNNPEDFTKVTTQLYNMPSTSGLGVEFVDTVLQNNPVSLFDTYTGYSGDTQFPIPGETVTMRAYDENVGVNGGIAKPFDPALGNKLYYLVSDTEYTIPDYQTLIAASTEITPALVSGNYDATFSYLNPSDYKYLYMIWDYRNGADCGDTISYTGDDNQNFYEFNVGAETGVVDFTYNVTVGTARFQLQYNGALVADSGAVSGSGTLSFIKRNTSPTTVTVIVTNENLGGGTVTCTLSVSCPVLQPIEIDPTNGDNANVCSQTSYGTYYADSESGNVELGARIYTDSAGTTPFNGADAYHRVGPLGDDFALIDANGYVVAFGSCNCNETNAPTVTQSTTYFDSNSSVFLQMEATNNPTSWELVSTCMTFELTGGSTGGVFSGVDCQTGLIKNVSVGINETVYSCMEETSIAQLSGSAASYAVSNTCDSQVLPSGLELDRVTGIVSGVAESSGTWSVTVNATNCVGTSSDKTFEIKIGGDEIQLIPIGIDLSGQASTAAACALTPSFSVLYHDGYYTFPVVGDQVWEASNRVSAFDGNDLWYIMNNNQTIQVGTDGTVNGIDNCATVSFPAVSLAYEATGPLACTSTSYVTHYYSGTWGVSGDLYTDAAGTTLAGYGWYKRQDEPYYAAEWSGTAWTLNQYICP